VVCGGQRKLRVTKGLSLRIAATVSFCIVERHRTCLECRQPSRDNWEPKNLPNSPLAEVVWLAGPGDPMSGQRGRVLAGSKMPWERAHVIEPETCNQGRAASGVQAFVPETSSGIASRHTWPCLSEAGLKVLNTTVSPDRQDSNVFGERDPSATGRSR